MVARHILARDIPFAGISMCQTLTDNCASVMVYSLRRPYTLYFVLSIV